MSRDDTRSPPISPSRASIGSDAGSLPLRSPAAMALPTVKPAPAYISQAAASDFATSHQRERLEAREDQTSLDPRGVPDATFAEQGLVLINGFIDHLLYQFLATARSTALPALRPAVEQILKPKLARQAFANADEELHDLLGDDEDGEEDEGSSVHSGEELRGRWDLDAVWRMTRLKVMVYTSTSDLDDEEEEQLSAEHMSPTEHRQSRHFGLVSWTASIFLTSILEFVGEHCLSVAGQAAYDRIAVKRRSKLSTPVEDDSQIVIVDEFDVERIALNSSLGRLWRSWRKSLRSTRSLALSSPTSSRRPSLISNHSPQASKSGDESKIRASAEANPAGVPTIQEQDIEERRERNTKAFEEMRKDVESSGLAVDPTLNRTRSRSFSALPAVAPIVEHEILQTPSRPLMIRRRSSSMPNPLRSNPPDIFAEESPPVPEIPQVDNGEEIQVDKDAEQTKDQQSGQLDDKVEDHTVTQHDRSRSVTPFEGESEYAADSERPDTALSTLTDTSLTGHVAESAAEHTSPSFSKKERQSDESTVQLSRDRDTTAQLGSLDQRDLTHKDNAVDDDMDASEAAAALNSLPPNVSKREMSADMALASAVPGAFPLPPDSRRPSQLQTVEEDQEYQEEETATHAEPQFEPSKQNPLDAQNALRSDKTHPVSTTMVAVPSNPSSIYDDAPQERQSPEAPEEPATPPFNESEALRSQHESPAQNIIPAYTGTTVTILDNSVPAKESYPITKVRSAPTHIKTASQNTNGEPQTQKSRSPKTAITASAEDNDRMERNFEGLMAAEQPKRYTLTPQNLRAIELDQEATSASPPAQPVARHKGGQNFSVTSVSDEPVPALAKKVGPSWSVKYGRPAANNTRPSKSGLLAREPRIQTESTREIAEFFRSTAPDSRPGPGGHVVPILVPDKSSNSTQAAAIAASAKSSRPSLEKSSSNPNQQVVTSPPRSAGTPRTFKSNLAAREATVPRKNVNEDLIDFLNSGPPGAAGATGLTRPPANGRATARSHDNLRTSNSMYDGRASAATTPSMQDSFHSHSPLVNSSHSSRMPGPPGGAPIRKQHRVKDPYALPSDDEDEDEDYTSAPPPKSSRQESLMDFLNNYDPPGSRQGPPTASAKAQKMLGTNGRMPKSAPPIAPQGSNGSSQVSLEASALPEFLRTQQQQQQAATPESYTTTTITSLSSPKTKKGFWKR